MPDYSFPPAHRLLRAEEFDDVFQNRDFSVSSSAILILAKRNTLGLNRLGMVIGKKNQRRAVDRNSTKRAIREAFRHWDINQALDIVVLARPGIRQQKNLKNHLYTQFNKLETKAIGQ